MSVAGPILLALSAVYAWHLAAFARGFRRTARASDARPPLADGDLPSVTVVIPARDEEDALGACLDGVLAQDYPRLQVLVVDDDSSDATPDIVRRRQAADPRLGLVQIPENRDRARAHKKAAVAKAVGQATGEIIFQTDADCLVPPGWVRAMVTAFDAPDVAFVSGPVAYRLAPGAGLLARLQAFDFFGVMVCGAGSIGLGRPTLANGACVAYRRDVFLRLGGFDGIDHVSSGDDELLMQKIAYGVSSSRRAGADGLTVRFCADPAALVLTDPQDSVRAVVRQRRRWASKSASYPPRVQRVVLSLGVFLAALAGATFALPFVPAFWPWFAGALAVKLAADLAVMLPAARRFGRRRLFWATPVHLLIHAPVAVVIGLLGPLGRFEWKGRSLDK